VKSRQLERALRELIKTNDERQEALGRCSSRTAELAGLVGQGSLGVSVWSMSDEAPAPRSTTAVVGAMPRRPINANDGAGSDSNQLTPVGPRSR